MFFDCLCLHNIRIAIGSRSFFRVFAYTVLVSTVVAIICLIAQKLLFRVRGSDNNVYIPFCREQEKHNERKR